MKISLFLSKYEPQVYAILRIMTGFLFLWHGSQKLFGVPPFAYPMSAFIIFTGIIEFMGGLLIMIGLLTRWAAFICSGQMAIAYWSVHGLHAILPIVNKGELAVLYCFLFLFFFIKGSGIFSLDYLLVIIKQKHKN